MKEDVKKVIDDLFEEIESALTEYAHSEGYVDAGRYWKRVKDNFVRQILKEIPDDRRT